MSLINKLVKFKTNIVPIQELQGIILDKYSDSDNRGDCYIIIVDDNDLYHIPCSNIISIVAK